MADNKAQCDNIFNERRSGGDRRHNREVGHVRCRRRKHRERRANKFSGLDNPWWLEVNYLDKEMQATRK